ncbi:geranylgeranyl pyrophosphate synthetase [Colletotrichum kahawae]|uniref:Geranylgeranyl pyrophosphate synthetase n=1 Tax=Colletotrichum kahawae TaxID=34407 RepID=A0AAD9Y964_COLKA|nr:geranylgeranyl pyrophosphate synthetase [Colletotrichum kahawae]
MLLVARYMARYQKKRISLDDVDIIATRSVLEELCYYSTNRESRFSRLNLYMVGTSLHVARPHTVDTDSTLVPIAGFGLNYEKAVTTLPSELHDSPTHLRNIKYKIGDLTCLVEAQVDAYCGKDAGYMRKANYKKAYDNGDTVVETADAGYKAPPRDGLAEIKTRSLHTKFRKTDEELEQRQSEDIRQTWFGRVTNMIQAHQQYGQFEKAEVQPIAHYWGQWEDANQLALQRMVTLLKHLRRGVKLSGGRNCAVLLRGRGDDFNKMEFYKTVDQEPTAPDELISEFWTQKQRPQATPEAWKEKKRARRLRKPAGLNNDKRTLALQKKLKIIRVELPHRTFRKYDSDYSEPAVAQIRESKPTNDTSKTSQTDTDKKSSIVGTKKVPLSQQNGKPAPKTMKTTPENGPAGGQMNAVTTTSGKAKRPTVPIKADWGQRNIAVAEKKTRQADTAKMAKAKPAARAFKPQPQRPKSAASADDGWGAAFGPVPGAGPRR